MIIRDFDITYGEALAPAVRIWGGGQEGKRARREGGLASCVGEERRRGLGTDEEPFVSCYLHPLLLHSDA